MAGEIDINTVAKAYARWAPVYDFVFGAVFDAGRKASIAAAERIGGRLPDVGIGTGIFLSHHVPPPRLVRVGYREPVLRKAHERGLGPGGAPCAGVAGGGPGAAGGRRWAISRSSDSPGFPPVATESGGRMAGGAGKTRSVRPAHHAFAASTRF